MLLTPSSYLIVFIEIYMNLSHFITIVPNFLRNSMDVPLEFFESGDPEDDPGQVTAWQCLAVGKSGRAG